MKASKPPYIPYIGLHTKDLIYIYDGNPWFIGQSVNFSKFAMLHESVSIIAKGITVPYDTEKAFKVILIFHFFVICIEDFSDLPLSAGPTKFE